MARIDQQVAFGRIFFIEGLIQDGLYSGPRDAERWGGSGVRPFVDRGGMVRSDEDSPFLE